MTTPTPTTTTADLTCRITHNDPSLRHLYLSSDGLSLKDVDQLTTALLLMVHNDNNTDNDTDNDNQHQHHQHHQNTHLNHVYFRNFKLGGSIHSMERLLGAMTGLGNLQSLFFHCTEVPVAHLIPLLLTTTTTVTLKVLGLRYCKLRYADEAEYQALEDALAHHASLQDVCLECCDWQSDTATPVVETNTHPTMTKMSSFLQAISHIPTLQHVECVSSLQPSTANNAANHNHNHHNQAAASQGRRRLPQSTLKRLCAITRLTSLRLRNVWLAQEDVALLCQTLLLQAHSDNSNHNNPCGLQKLLLSCDLGTVAATALGQYLQDPRCTLEQLSLRVDRLDDPDCPALMAQALAHQHQQHYSPYYSPPQEQQQQQQHPFVPTIVTNNNNNNQNDTMGGRRRGLLQHFHLSGAAASQISEMAKAAFCDMMQTNVALEFVRLEVNDYALQGQIAFFLQLNHQGRRELFDGIQLQQQQHQQQQQQQQHQQQGEMTTTISNNKEKDNDEEASLWIQALCQNTSDVRALHYFVALHPGLFAMAALAAHQRHAQHQKHQQLQQYQQRQMELEVGIEYDTDGW